MIAVIPKTTATDFWESLHEGVSDGAKGTHFQILWNAPQSEADYAQQSQMVERAIQEKVGGIILAPSHETVLASAVRHAKAEHIPVVIVDSPVAVTSSHYLAYIASNNSRIGEVAAVRMGKKLGGKGQIAIIGVSPTIEDAVMREQAFARTIAARFPQISLVDVQYGLSNSGRSRALTLDLLRDHPALSGIFASDEFATRGAVSALRQSDAQKTVILIGVAQEHDMLDEVRQGFIDSLVIQDPYRMGYLAVKDLISRPNGHSSPMIETGIALATRQNIDSPEIQQLVSHYSR